MKDMIYLRLYFYTRNSWGIPLNGCSTICRTEGGPRFQPRYMGKDKHNSRIFRNCHLSTVKAPGMSKLCKFILFKKKTYAWRRFKKDARIVARKKHKSSEIQTRPKAVYLSYTVLLSLCEIVCGAVTKAWGAISITGVQKAVEGLKFPIRSPSSQCRTAATLSK